MKTLLSLLKDGLGRVGGSQAALADAIGLSRPRVNRLLREGEEGYPLGTKACFALATLVHEDPAAVLRLAGKDWLADALDELRKGQRKDQLTTEERALLRSYSTAQAQFPGAVAGVRQALDELATEARRGRPARRRASARPKVGMSKGHPEGKR